MLVPAILILCLVFSVAEARPQTQLEKDERLMHFIPKSHVKKRSIDQESVENSAEYWIRNAQETLHRRLRSNINTNVAKNVILFLGDGMSIPTITAARMYLGGEEMKLAFDDFPHTGLSKTYCTDKQVADSACSATAYLGGVKGNLGTIGVTGSVKLDDCEAMRNSSFFVDSIANWSQGRGKRTGLVTTSRVTHASPAGVYAHTAQRDWESDSDVKDANKDSIRCRDIAYQLVNWRTGHNLNVIMGGGRREFLPKETVDEGGVPGNRSDGANLIKQWLDNKAYQGSAEYVSNRDELLNSNEDTDYLLGLFDTSHIPYNLERNASLVPSLEEMTEVAIRNLGKSDNGYFLFVEGARIDMAHHETWARKSLDETLEFSKAIKKAVELTDEEDTLIVVTSDHAHTMSFSGYASRGSSIFELAGEDMEGFPYTTLNYANGMGYHKEKNGVRYNVKDDNFNDVDYRYPAIYPLVSETHGGDDVAIFARGPWSHLFTGVLEQNVIPHMMAYASCVGKGFTVCDMYKEFYQK